MTATASRHGQRRRRRAGFTTPWAESYDRTHSEHWTWAPASLSVQQEEMEISGQNMANVNNTAYADEQLVVSGLHPAGNPHRRGRHRRASDRHHRKRAIRCLDSQIQAEASVTGSLTAQQSNLQNAEAYLDEQISSTSSSSTPDSPNGLATGLSNLFNSFSSLANDPGIRANRQAAVQSAQEVAGAVQPGLRQLSTVQADLNTSVQNDVATSNQDLSTIATLNQQIVVAQASGGSADQLVDQREQTIGEPGRPGQFLHHHPGQRRRQCQHRRRDDGFRRAA